MTEAITGGCLSGACRYTTDAAAIDVRVCHCHLCQKATGAPLYARVRVPIAGLAVTGPVGWHRSSEPLRRGFCRECGTSLFSERASDGVIGLTMGSLDDPDRFVPEAQIFTASKQAWVELGGLLAYPEFPDG